MDSDKYTGRVTLQCPTCGSDEFSYDGNLDESPVTCTTCGRTTRRDQLIRENSGNIQACVSEIGRKATGDAVEKLNRNLREAFKATKNITLK